ncbi:conjugal transfer protein [Streptomyces litmocidini]|uniref:conjugal transfer protein n=1 Tax=Streptomyces litmocidini TaxID=67318 RepID=UPI0033D133AB
MPPPAPFRSRRDPRPAGARSRVTPLRGRRAFLVRAGVWAALAAGPAALLVALDRPALAPVKSAVAARPAAVQQTADRAGDSGAAGFAETVLGVWLESGTATESSEEMAQLRLLAPGVQSPRWGRRPVAVVQVAAVRTERRGTGSWAVTVAARLADAVAGVPEGQSARGLRFFTVPVTKTGSGDGRAYAAGAPMEAAGPQAGREPASPYTARVEDTTLADTVDGFLSAFLSADGAVERYLAPGTALPRPEPRFTAVETLQILSQGRSAGAGQDGATARVRAEVTATDAAGRSWPMAYALTLTARDGRWEVASLGTGPAAPAASRS